MAPAPERIRTIARECGFDLVRFGPAGPGEDGQRFVDWLEKGRHGEMRYLECDNVAFLHNLLAALQK